MIYFLAIRDPGSKWSGPCHYIEDERATLAEVLEDAYENRDKQLKAIFSMDAAGNVATVMNELQIAIKIEAMEKAREIDWDAEQRRADGTPVSSVYTSR